MHPVHVRLGLPRWQVLRPRLPDGQCILQRRCFQHSAPCGIIAAFPRVQNLQSNFKHLYPRVENDGSQLPCSVFRRRYEHLRQCEVSRDLVTLRGKIRAIRRSGARLIFIDIDQGSNRVQIMYDFRKLDPTPAFEHFRQVLGSLQRGDHIEARGSPTRTGASRTSDTGELSLCAVDLPNLMSPSLQTVPLVLEDPETKMRNRHLDIHLNKNIRDIILYRSAMITSLRKLLTLDGFVEVQTPIISGVAGGAVARPFVTSATEFPSKTLALRIAPELWLKRLIVAGLNRVFEIGASFRNEGLDLTHNPEFTTCEFYEAYANLDCLLSKTEEIMSALADEARELKTRGFRIDPPQLQFKGPYRRLDFIPEIEDKIGQKLPNLHQDDARAIVADMAISKGIQCPAQLNLPQILDKLCTHFLESQCSEPTWIIKQPECLSPLSKSYLDAKSGQMVAARGELFVQGREVVNTYEEENSPFEQRRKFEQQQQYRNADDGAVLDESYLNALEWGLPPTGGWGAGIDRLCMLMAGSDRISDVLTFGNLRNVMATG